MKRTTADIAADVLVAHASKAMRREVADRLNELDHKVVAVRTIIATAIASMPCSDPGVPWDALADISKAIR